MKTIGIITTATLSVLLGIAAPLYAQEQHDQKDDHAQSEERKDKPAQAEEKRAQEDKSSRQEEKTAQEQDKNSKQEEKTAQQQDKNARHEETTTQHTQEVKTERTERTTEGSHRRIPDDRFRASFGHEHVFIINRPVIVEGHPRFQYGGYWFGFGEPWPVGWLYTDNVYVDYVGGGYYLYNPVHPGIHISINII